MNDMPVRVINLGSSKEVLHESQLTSKRTTLYERQDRVASQIESPLLDLHELHVCIIFFFFFVFF